MARKHNPLNSRHIEVCPPCKDIASEIAYAKARYTNSQRYLSVQRHSRMAPASKARADCLFLIKKWRDNYRTLVSIYGGDAS